MMRYTKKQLLKEVEERIGDHYLYCRYGIALLGGLRGSFNNYKVDRKIDEIILLLEHESRNELKEKVKK